MKTQPLEATYQKIKRAQHACTYHQQSGFGCRVEVFHEDDRSKIVRKCKPKSNVLTNSTTMQVTNFLHPTDTLNRKVNDRGPMQGLLRNCRPWLFLPPSSVFLSPVAVFGFSPALFVVVCVLCPECLSGLLLFLFVVPCLSSLLFLAPSRSRSSCFVEVCGTHVPKGIVMV